MDKAKRKSTVSANIKKKRLYINLQGIISKTEVERIYTEIRFCVADLGPGFSVITDLTNCRIGHLSGIATFSKIMGFLLEREVGHIVRIVGEAKVIYLQMLRLADKARGYEPKYVKTPEEAEALLDSLENKGNAVPIQSPGAG